MSAGADSGVLIIAIILYVAIIAFFIFCWWKIWSKAGFNGAWSLLMIVPIVGFIAFIYFTFSDWPVHKRLGGPDTFN